MFTIAVSMLLPPSGSAGGGSSIAAAPQLPLNVQVTGGAKQDCRNFPYAGTEYWRVKLTPGAALVLDYGSVNGQGVNIRVYRPDVTDYTIAHADTSAADSTTAKDELRFRANVAGSWLVVVWGGCNAEYGYQLIARVQTKTTVRLSGPRRIRPGGQGTLRGQVVGATGGEVSLQSRTHGHWRTFSSASISSDGTFSWQGTFSGHCGNTWANRAVFAGDQYYPAGASRIVTTRATC
jgi:hypothetical protein